MFVILLIIFLSIIVLIIWYYVLRILKVDIYDILINIQSKVVSVIAEFL